MKKITPALCVFFQIFVVSCFSQTINSKTSLEVVKENIFKVLADNNQMPLYNLYTRYVGSILDRTSGDKWWNDKNGYFRFSIIDRWLRNPFDCIIDGDKITFDIHNIAKNGMDDMNKLLMMCCNFCDFQVEYNQPTKKKKKILQSMQENLLLAENNVRFAFEKFSHDQLIEFAELMQRITVREIGNEVAHSVRNRQEGLAMCSKVSKVKIDNLIIGTMVLCDTFKNPEFETLKRIKPGRYGRILVGTSKNDTYNIDTMRNIDCIIDPSGNDTYIGGKTGPDKPLLVIIDFEGDDRYISKDGYSQGSGFFGISILYDIKGNDVYQAGDVSQGSALVGVGILIDNNGDDVYNGDRRAQGSSVVGIGLLIDKNGNDMYSVNLFGQGYGGMLGIGVLEDSRGNDHYIAGGKYDDSYQEPPHYYKHAWSQGCGSGFRGVSNGGIGIILDGGGDDIYEADYFSTGGYWFAAGLARDFEGNDIRRPLTHNFSRYGFGYACHYGIGLLYDDTGNDTYIGTLGIQGFGWDIGTAAVVDFSGDDSYTATISGQGFACQGSFALLIDMDGSDVYNGGNPRTTQGIPGSLEYHPKNLIGGNFSFLIDSGKGTDSFSCGAKQNCVNQRSTENGVGYLIDIE